MKLTNTTLQMARYHLDVLWKMFVGGALRETNKTADEIAALLEKWKPLTIESFMAQELLPDDGGPDALEMTIEDFRGKSPEDVRKTIQNALVRHLVFSFGGGRCNYLVARILQVHECRVRRIRLRMGMPTARELKKARREEQEKVAA